MTRGSLDPTLSSTSYLNHVTDMDKSPKVTPPIFWQFYLNTKGGNHIIDMIIFEFPHY